MKWKPLTTTTNERKPHGYHYVPKKGGLEIAKVHNHVPKQVVPKKNFIDQHAKSTGGSGSFPI